LPYWALGVSHILQFARAFVTVAYFIAQSHFSHFAPHLPVDTGHRFTSFLSAAFHNAGYQLFSSPAGSFGLRAFLLFVAINSCNKKCPRVVYRVA
jgi:hypothetical protein